MARYEWYQTSFLFGKCLASNEINGMVAALMEVGGSTIADEMFLFDYCLGKEVTPRETWSLHNKSSCLGYAKLHVSNLSLLPKYMWQKIWEDFTSFLAIHGNSIRTYLSAKGPTKQGGSKGKVWYDDGYYLLKELTSILSLITSLPWVMHDFILAHILVHFEALASEDGDSSSTADYFLVSHPFQE
ncbi:hypothetical protein V6N11_077130 [Hibiscus sabdariffa]|uniref:Uncharacterized protein n=1 Tax=Hibiscus sabdariffa TaxID=183260 RepID=A0ABR2TCZ2_9ROSI